MEGALPLPSCDTDSMEAPPPVEFLVTFLHVSDQIGAAEDSGFIHMPVTVPVVP